MPTSTKWDWLSVHVPHHPIDVHVGARLKMLRLQRTLSQTAVAEQVGLTFQQVQKYENGSNRISASRLVEFAAALGVPILAFFEGLPDEISVRPAFREPSTLDYDIAGLLKRLANNPVKRELRALIRVLADVAEEGRTDRR